MSDTGTITPAAPAEADRRHKHVGAPVQRVEDGRLVSGQAQYVANIQLPRMLHLAFARSHVAHGILRGIDTSEALGLPGVAAAVGGADIADECEPIRGDAWHDRWQPSEQWPLAIDRVRFVGEPIAAVVAKTRYQAEDGAELVVADVEPLEPVTTVEGALAGDSPLLHEGWSDNCFVKRRVSGGDVDHSFATAPHTLQVTCVMGRHSCMPLETRGSIADYDAVDDRLTLWSSHQQPHILRTSIAEALRFPEHRVRVIAPDVGGAFGSKCLLYPEELSVCVLALRLRRPVKWIEDRSEHMLASCHARDHRHEIEVAYEDDGEILGVRARVWVDCGAYSIFPWTAGMEPSNAVGILPGPYRISNYHAEGFAVATNKCPGGPYRGVARVPANFSMERAVDQVARSLGLDPLEVRRRNMIRSEEFPYTSVTGKIYDSGSYIESLDELVERADLPGLRAWQERERAGGRVIGIGAACYIEQTAHGVEEYVLRRLPLVFGYDTATVRVDPSGGVAVLGGIHSHGQGLETTLAQIAADVLGTKLGDVRVIFGDTDACPYGGGTFGSRSAVLCGGATDLAAGSLREKLVTAAAHFLEVDVADVELGDGYAYQVDDTANRMSISDLAHVFHLRPDRLPPGLEPVLDATATYDAPPGRGTFGNGAHLAVVEVDDETGHVEVIKYVVVSDCGRMINPTIVDGQHQGGVCQGIGGALFEEFLYDELGNPLSTTLLDYHMPNAADIPDIEVSHLETPSPFTRLGIKGVGEAGIISPAPAIASALEDALSPSGRVFVGRTPFTPERVLGYVDEARSSG